MAKDKAPADVNDKAQRRVYVLDAELVERIAEYQQKAGFSSEVEAVRRLLDSALKAQDTTRRIVDRIYSQKAQSKPLEDAIRDVIWGHPLLKSMSIDDADIVVRFKNDEVVIFDVFGTATWLDNNDNPIQFEQTKPNWASSRHRVVRAHTASVKDAIDDDIPF